MFWDFELNRDITWDGFPSINVSLYWLCIGFEFQKDVLIADIAGVHSTLNLI